MDNSRCCDNTKTLSVLAVKSLISSESWLSDLRWNDDGSSDCILYMSNSLEMGGILGSALPVMFGACFNPNLLSICSFITSRLNARICARIRHTLQPLFAPTNLLLIASLSDTSSPPPKSNSRIKNALVEVIIPLGPTTTTMTNLLFR